ncbi:c-type cytochrome [Abyssibius alkaniclasticus]|uniref:c-type cytochrome n=1 Tax=Abyssibius alkaniclasticus TaxID=2881234 RepID=UPI004059FB64|tara:strand:- start:203 stop:679 length:477 start_codon:yes stop_codon:yes gene_type:complete
MKPTTLFAIAGLSAIGAGAQAQSGPSDLPLEGLFFLGAPVPDGAVQIGQQLYAENCASCHGVNLEGQPDWRRRLDTGRMPAPPHDVSGHTWHHSDRALFLTTRGGVGAVVPGYESDMPAFEGILTDDEIVAVLAYIKSTWPEQQRTIQAEITASDPGR